jgi:non-heme chloroperoxidase
MPFIRHGNDYDTLASDLHCLLEKLDLHGVTLIGHSMGGAEIIRYNTLYGNFGRVSRQVLSGTPDCIRKLPDHPEGVDDDLINQRLEEIAGDYPSWLDKNIDEFFLPETYPISEGMKNWTKVMMLQITVDIFINMSRTVLNADLREEVRNIRIPTLVMHGDRDASIPFFCGQSIADAIPGAVFIAYPGAPHGLNLSLKDKVNRDLAAFVTGEVH